MQIFTRTLLRDCTVFIYGFLLVLDAKNKTASDFKKTPAV